MASNILLGKSTRARSALPEKKEGKTTSSGARLQMSSMTTVCEDSPSIKPQLAVKQNSATQSEVHTLDVGMVSTSSANLVALRQLSLIPLLSPAHS